MTNVAQFHNILFVNAADDVMWVITKDKVSRCNTIMDEVKVMFHPLSPLFYFDISECVVELIPWPLTKGQPNSHPQLVKY